jgi:hypothetical protein
MGLVMSIHQIVETDILWPEREARFKEREMLAFCSFQKGVMLPVTKLHSDPQADNGPCPM